jgi:hypothetical protein
MSRQEVRQAFGAPVESFVKNPLSGGPPVDAFNSLGIHAYYGRDDRCEAFEAGADADVTLNGHSLLRMRYAELEPIIKAEDPESYIHSDGLRSDKLGIDIYIPGLLHRGTQRIEGVLVFASHYWQA